MKNFFRKIGKTFKKIGEFVSRIWDWPTVEKYAKELLDLASFFGLISRETRDRLKTGIDAGEGLVLDGVAKFENIIMSVDELIGALKLLLAEVFPKGNAGQKAAPRGFMMQSASSEAMPLDILSQHIGHPAGAIADEFTARPRGVGTAEFIELCNKLKAARADATRF